MIAFGLGSLGYAGSIVFYNSFLPVIAAPEDQDKISARGYSMGYIGGVVLLLFNLWMILLPGWFGIPDGSPLAGPDLFPLGGALVDLVFHRSLS
ncbi:MAG: hypothetical protein MZV63_41375 [Marinilabiliales bacterium]|nr:hypothetical protein [Marinilabiliales bacterium]